MKIRVAAGLWGCDLGGSTEAGKCANKEEKGWPNPELRNRDRDNYQFKCTQKDRKNERGGPDLDIEARKSANSNAPKKREKKETKTEKGKGKGKMCPEPPKSRQQGKKPILFFYQLTRERELLNG